MMAENYWKGLNYGKETTYFEFFSESMLGIVVCSVEVICFCIAAITVHWDSEFSGLVSSIPQDQGPQPSPGRGRVWSQ